jgi:hypothetical protein
MPPSQPPIEPLSENTFIMFPLFLFRLNLNNGAKLNAYLETVQIKTIFFFHIKIACRLLLSLICLFVSHGNYLAQNLREALFRTK